MPFVAAHPRDRLILALDVATVAEAERLIAELRGTVGVWKIGYRLVFAGGLALAERLVAEGEKVFLDVKLLDIDNTVAEGIASILATGVDWVTLHAYPKAMRAAVAAKAAMPAARTRLLGVTVLTSMDDADLAAAGYTGRVDDLVLARARDAVAAGMDGIVCSAAEAARLRAAVGPDLVLVTPGVRPAGSPAGDQKRVTTPGEAIRAGADLVVVGRPILAAPDRRAAAVAIVADLAEACEKR
ncbi:orotidine-5'-phosphate decarboxylase [Siculibacillus lacustris]|uniref:Orotidine 5'-phosphate decarboxylase n=1 Tax=Siculibacillus lacustris TaxID=1549641 RepID=A0A4V2KTY3_9HYPH|nr:orotidine-5'-phosphate decarboxylase [Siculibacillus lacustris]TBW39195.1 orotidine-5'-phosphate decarboxylase [Siculibacillus lacustris]